MRILVVEDRPRMAETVRKALTAGGHTVTLAHDGESALDLALGSEFEVLILDVLLPKLDGFELIRTLRAKGVTTATLMLTACDTDEAVINGLDAGADDYLTKPFSLAVLGARVRALGRRAQDHEPLTQLTFDDLMLRPETRDALRGDREITLTRTEYALLEALLRNKGRVVRFEAMIEYGWGLGAEVDPSALYVVISNLRGKLNLGHETPLLRTIRGAGYIL